MLQDPASQAAWNDAIQASALVCLQEHVHVSVTSNICYGSCQQTVLLCAQATATLDGGEAASQRSGITSGLSEVSCITSLSQQAVQERLGLT